MNQSFKRTFVTNTGVLLPAGNSTPDLAVHQVGLFDGNTYQSTVTPTYFDNKTLVIGWGYPDTPNAALMDGLTNQNELVYIKGRSITDVRVKRAVHGRPEIVTLGFSGSVSDTDTLSVKPGETKYFYVRLTGAPIDRIYSKQGFIRRYAVEGPCIDDCADGCATDADNRAVADSLVKQITNDPKVKGLIKVSKIESCDPALTPDTISAYAFRLTVADDNSAEALGYVQTQYPGFKVTKVQHVGIYSTYELVRDANTTPTAFSNAGLTIIPDCATCPAGYTSVTSKFVYEVKRADDGDATALTTINTDYGIVSPETSVRLSYQNGTSIYVIVSSTSQTASGTDQFKSLGFSTQSCVLTTPTTTAWTLYATLTRYAKVYQLTLADECDADRLTDVQAAFPDLTVSLVDGDGDCAHTYETTVYSDPVDPTCSIELLKFTAPDAFEGTPWVEVAPDALADGTTCLVGVKFESAWVDRITNNCTYGYYPYEADGVHIEVSEYDANYNGEPEKCKLPSTAVKTIQSLIYPQGEGSYVRLLEEKSKELFTKNRSFDPIRREIEGYAFAADPYKYYDEISIDFSTDYPVGGFSQRYTDNHTLRIFVQEGLGGAIVTALNRYITSPEIGLDARNY